MRRTRLVSTVSALLAAAVTAGVTLAAAGGRSVVHIEANSHRPYAIGLWGDMPYSVEQATVGMPNLIADINSQPHPGGLLLPAADRAGEQGRGARALIVSKHLGDETATRPDRDLESRSGRLLTGRAALAVYL